MEVVIKKNSQQASALAAALIQKQILKSKGECVLGLATGSTPLESYLALVKLHAQKKLSFKKLKTFNLDEYVGLEAADPNSYRTYMEKNLFSKVDIVPKNTFLPSGTAKNIEQECAKYEKKIKSLGGIDLQLLGIGRDGHIGFNEPGSSLSSRTRIKTLTPQTRQANGKYFGSAEEVPKHVITMGLGTILEAKICVLLAFGEEKAAAVAEMVEGPVSASVPASVLQFHPRCIAIIDEAAASRLKRKSYYLQVYSDKPAWQSFE